MWSGRRKKKRRKLKSVNAWPPKGNRVVDGEETEDLTM